MKILKLILVILSNVVLVIILDSAFLALPPLGSFFSPQHGLWQNADFTLSQTQTVHKRSPFFPLDSTVSIAIDTRGVPHIFATKWEDALFAQGYMHAKDRLFQMDFLSRLAAGRLSEWLGKGLLDLDMYHRRSGLVISAENMEIEILKNTKTQSVSLAYVAGVNYYIANLKKSNYPIEYKILDIKPEKWNVYKTALVAKYLSFNLTGYPHDIAYTKLKKILSQKEFNLLYPVFHHFLDPIIPKKDGQFSKLTEVLPPANIDKNYLDFQQSAPKVQHKTNLPLGSIQEDTYKPYIKGSNNWAIASRLSATSSPILCNDPHLRLTLPSPWYEVQLSTNEDNVYGLSTPGTPFIIIGFNQHLSWGMTSAQRDVLDYYYVNWVEGKTKSYLYDANVYPADFRIEEYEVKGGQDVTDTLWMTHIGPILPKAGPQGEDIAVQWIGKVSSNEMLYIWGINASKNITDFKNSLHYLYSPGLTFTFSTYKDIGLIQQGAFPMKWHQQGDFIMPFTAEYQWKQFIPFHAQPQMINPKRGFVSSANQNPTDENYPFYVGNRFPVFRGSTINNYLRSIPADHKASVQDMMNLQTNNKNNLAKVVSDNILATYVNKKVLTTAQRVKYEKIMKWDFIEHPQSLESALFKVVWQELKNTVFNMLLPKQKDLIYPQDVTLLELLLEVSEFEELITSKSGLSIYDIVHSSFVNGCKTIDSLKAKKPQWWRENRQAHISHLLRLGAFGHIVEAGGSSFSINAIQKNHGPSVRLIVSMEPEIKAYVACPGGQSGNPGNIHYDDGITTWATGKYNSVNFVQQQKQIPSLEQTIEFSSNAKD